MPRVIGCVTLSAKLPMERSASMQWHKLGLVYTPGGQRSWSRTHAFLPTADVIGDRIRVYFTGLDDQQYGRIGAVDLDGRDPRRVMAESAEPLLDLGQLGGFDDCGVNASSIVTIGTTKYLYYIGWQRALRVPHLLFSGLAISRHDGPFERLRRVPVLDRTADEPFSRSAPYVIQEDGRLRMWYWTCTGWREDSDRVRYLTVIRHATSADGVDWSVSAGDCICPDGADDFAVGRPCVVCDAGLYRMWYSIRSRDPRCSYRIGYAESGDGLRWVKKRDLALQPSPSGWDSDMVCYPCVVDSLGERYLFYNGNHHGFEGFGCAVLDT
jgi:hypothetical protein